MLAKYENLDAFVLCRFDLNAIKLDGRVEPGLEAYTGPAWGSRFNDRSDLDNSHYYLTRVSAERLGLESHDDGSLFLALAGTDVERETFLVGGLEITLYRVSIGNLEYYDVNESVNVLV